MLSACILVPGLIGCSDDTVDTGIPVLRVPADYPTPQEAIDAADPGTVVDIDAGVYTHTEVRDIDPVRFPGGVRAALFLKAGVRVRGTGDLGTVILRDTTAADSTVGALGFDVDDQTWIVNLNFENFGTGVSLAAGSGVVLCCSVTGSETGIRFEDFGGFGGGGFNLTENCGTGILVEDGFAILQANLIRGCDTGLHLRGAGVPDLLVNVICLNGTGLLVEGPDMGPGLRGNVTRDNTVVGGLFTAGADPVFLENDFAYNPVNLAVEGYAGTGVDSILVQGQWWGSTVLDSIAASILDADDEAGRGARVIWLPVRPVTSFPFDASEVDVDMLCAATTPTARRVLQAWESRSTFPAPTGGP